MSRSSTRASKRESTPLPASRDELGRRRPDIPLLVVESRGTREHLAACGLDLAAAANIQIMPHTTDPRQFWALTKILLLPSLWWENQPLVAIEAMVNGIPVVGSNRGGIPETLGESGLTLPLPDRLTQVSRIVPTADEVEPWIEAIVRLWDDRRFYDEQGTRSLNEARRWHPDRLRPLYAEFFGNVRSQPGSPVIESAQSNRGNLRVGWAPPTEASPGGRSPPYENPSARCAKTSAGPPGTSVIATAASQVINGLSHRVSKTSVTPLSFVACVSDDTLLGANLLASPDLVGPGSPNELILIHDAPSAAAGYTMGRQRAKHEWLAGARGSRSSGVRSSGVRPISKLVRSGRTSRCQIPGFWFLSSGIKPGHD